MTCQAEGEQHRATPCSGRTRRLGKALHEDNKETWSGMIFRIVYPESSLEYPTLISKCCTKLRFFTIPYGYLQTHSADCSLRQGAGGTEFAHFGSRTCFLRWFYKRSQTYFGQKSEEHIKTIKKRCLESRTTSFEKNVLLQKKGVFFELFPLFKGPGRAHMGPYGPIWAHMGPYGPIWTRKIKKNT